MTIAVADAGAGVAVADAGAGVAVADAGAGVTDAGAAVTDGRTAPADAGTVTDAAAAHADAGATVTDAAAAAHAGTGARRRPGRPRDGEIDGQILHATLSIIDAGDDVTVGRVVERSGVSRAALYRRWPSLTTLIAAALDVGRAVPPAYPEGQDLREMLLSELGLGPAGVAASAPGYSEERFRQRIRLVMADRALQKAYWRSHVSRRRVPLITALRAGVSRGELRADLDLDACFDAMAGAAYYQIVVRGESLDDPEVRPRMRAAIEVIWRGMLA